MSKQEGSQPVYEFARVSLDVVQVVPYPTTGNMVEVFDQLGLVREPQEMVWVVTYDSMKQIRTIVVVAKGGYHDVTVHVPTVLSAVLLSATDRFVLVHNHPAGDVSPTPLDIDLTRTVMEAANACGLYFEDHLIVGPPRQLSSMAAAGIMIPSPDLKLMAAGKRPRR